MKKVKLTENVFRTGVTLCYDCSLKEFEDYWKKYDKRISDFIGCNNEALGMHITNGEWHLIFIEDITDVGTIAHELLHFISKTLSKRRIYLQESEETYCYLLEYYLEKILKIK